MYPAVGEVNLHTVNIINLSGGILCKHLLDLDEDGVDIGLWGEVDAILGNLIVGELLTQLADGAVFLGQGSEEEGDAYEGVTTIVALGIDDSAVAFAADDGTYFLHLRGDIDLADGRGCILATVFLRDIAQGAGAGEVGDGCQFTVYC